MFIGDVNWLAIIVSVIWNMILGSVWYNPKSPTGKAWIQEMNFTPERMAAAQQKGMGKLYVMAAIGAAVTAYVLSHVVRLANATSAIDGIIVGFWVWLGFIAPVFLGNILWESKSTRLTAINVAYHLVSLAIMGIILTLWQ